MNASDIRDIIVSANLTLAKTIPCERYQWPVVIPESIMLEWTISSMSGGSDFGGEPELSPGEDAPCFPWSALCLAIDENMSLAAFLDFEKDIVKAVVRGNYQERGHYGYVREVGWMYVPVDAIVCSLRGIGYAITA